MSTDTANQKTQLVTSNIKKSKNKHFYSKITLMMITIINRFKAYDDISVFFESFLM